MFDFIYTSKNMMLISEALASIDRASPQLVGFKREKANPEASETLRFKGPLQPPRIPSGVDLVGISEIHATLRADRSQTSLQNLLKRIRPDLGVPCSLWVGTGTPVQRVTPAWGDGFIVGASLGCEALGNAVGMSISVATANHDVQKLRAFYEHLAVELSLPLECIDHSAGFALSGKGSSRMEMFRTHPDGANPYGFHLGLPNRSWDEMPGLLWSVIQQFSERRMSLEWMLRPRPESKGSLGLRLLETAIRKKWPADSYEVSMDLRLRKIEALDALQGLLRGSLGQFRICLANFTFGEDEFGEVGIETTQHGHRLLLNMSSPVGALPVLKAFGLKFAGDTKALDAPNSRRRSDSSSKETAAGTASQPGAPKKSGAFDYFAQGDAQGENDSDWFYVPQLFTREEVFAIQRKLRTIPGDFQEFDRVEIGAGSFWRGKGRLPELRFIPEILWRECKIKIEFSTCGIPVDDFNRLLRDFVKTYPERQRGVPQSVFQLRYIAEPQTGPFLLVARGEAYSSGSRCHFNSGGMRYEGSWNRVPKDFLERAAVTSPLAGREDNRWELRLRHDEAEDADLRGTNLGCHVYQWAQEHSLPSGEFEVYFNSVIKGQKGFNFLEKLRVAESEIRAPVCNVQWSNIATYASFEVEMLPKGNRLHLTLQHPDLKRALKAVSTVLGLKFRRL